MDISYGPGKVTDPPVNNKHSQPEDQVNIYHKKEGRSLWVIFKNAFLVIESFQFQICKVKSAAGNTELKTINTYHSR